jgi:hypothetical protein
MVDIIYKINKLHNLKQGVSNEKYWTLQYTRFQRGEHQPNSEGAVLKNLLNITSEVEIEKVETIKFAELSEKMIYFL